VAVRAPAARVGSPPVRRVTFSGARDQVVAQRRPAAHGQPEPQGSNGGSTARREDTVAQSPQKAQDQAPSTIEHEMEATRQRLAGTIDQLVYRASPKTIIRREVATVKAFFVDAQGNPRTDNILKVAGGVAGFVAFVVVMRKITS
jgi:hypothetical protein